jgi:hypothetical protein
MVKYRLGGGGVRGGENMKKEKGVAKNLFYVKIYQSENPNQKRF